MSRVVCAETGAALWTLEQDKLQSGDESVVGSLMADVVSAEKYDSVVKKYDAVVEKFNTAVGEVEKLREELARMRPRSPRKERDILEAIERDKLIGGT